MPMIDDGSNNLVQQVLALAQFAQGKRERQGSNLISIAQPGQTVGDIGMTPQMFAAVFGKDTPYDPKRQVKDIKATDMLDSNLKSLIQGMDPQTALNVAAGQLSRSLGGTGITTLKGLQAGQKTGEVQAVAGQHSAESVAQMIDEGIAAMAKAAPATREAIGQQAAYGTTATGAEYENLKGQLGIASVKSAIEAQTNPNAPIHKFLKDVGLNLPTVLAGSALGLNNLFDTYSRAIFTNGAQNKEASNIILRAQLETAKDMSEKIFHGKLTPNQVLTVIKYKETGQPLPAGLQAAGEVYDRAVEVNYQAAMAEAIRKGDPMVTSMATQLSAVQKPGVDPYQLSSVRDLSSRMAAYALTSAQVGPMPVDQAGMQRWNEVYEANLKKAPKIGVRMPLFHSNLPAEGVGAGGAGIPASTGMDRSPATTRPGPGTGASTGTGLNPASLSPEDSQAISNYLRTILPVTPTTGTPPQ